jgi:hypothetical protein
MAYSRGAASDFDDWGVDGWESKSLIPLMKKVPKCIVGTFIKLTLSLHS